MWIWGFKKGKSDIQTPFGCDEMKLPWNLRTLE